MYSNSYIGGKMKKTKIIATIGPACNSKEIITEMAKSGMNVARINMSHANHETHTENIRLVREVRDELDIPIAILADTRGPEIRLAKFAEGHIEVEAGDKFMFSYEDIVGDKTKASITYKDLYLYVNAGDAILLCDGLIKMQVMDVDGKNIHLVVIIGGVLSNNKSINVPGIDLQLPYLSESDKEDLLFAIAQDVDFIAASFVSTREDLISLISFIKENGANDIDIIAKIESAKGVENIEEIMACCQGIMIARGDLGVEIPYERLPQLQKCIVKKSRDAGKRVIVATEMLESMISSPRPTRAETSDVANAVYDGTSAVMLSGETAAGKHPVRAVKTMSDILEHTEQNIHYKKRFNNQDFKILNIADSISSIAVKASYDIDADAIIVVTETGASPRMVSRFRPVSPVFAIAHNSKSYYKLALSWGVTPIFKESIDSFEELYNDSTVICKEKGLIAAGDKVVLVASTHIGKSGATNIVKIEIVE